MPAYTYTGDQPALTLRGVTFPAGEAVEVDDPEFEKKLDNLPDFGSDKPEPEPAPVAAETSAEDALRGQLAAATLRIKHLEAQLKAASEPEGADEDYEPALTVDEEPVEKLTTYTPGQPGQIEIPDDWRDMHWKRQMVLAKNFTDDEINDQATAVSAIEAELMRRGDQD